MDVAPAVPPLQSATLFLVDSEGIPDCMTLRYIVSNWALTSGFLLQSILDSLRVSLGTNSTKFSAALNSNDSVSVEGVVKDGKKPFITRVGRFDVDLSVEGIVILVRQSDRPGIIAGALPHPSPTQPLHLSLAQNTPASCAATNCCCNISNPEPTSNQEWTRLVVLFHTYPEMVAMQSCQILDSSGNLSS